MTPEEAEVLNHQLVTNYRTTFGSPAGQQVMLDLMAFCKFRKPAEDQYEEGMRRVFLRIMDFMSFTPEELLAFYRGRPSLTGDKANG